MLLSKEFVFTFGSKNQELSSCDNDAIKLFHYLLLILLFIDSIIFF